jgi:hypothetical protein
MKKWLQRLLALLPRVRRRRERSLDEELASYLEMAEETAREQGLSTPEARRAACRTVSQTRADKLDIICATTCIHNCAWQFSAAARPTQLSE